MQKSKPEPDPDAACRCGRRRDQSVTTVYQSHAAVFVFHRCSCGLEWTERQELVDRSQPVSSDEVIEVHVALARFQGPLSQLIGLPQT